MYCNATSRTSYCNHIWVGLLLAMTGYCLLHLIGACHGVRIFQEIWRKFMFLLNGYIRGGSATS